MILIVSVQDYLNRPLIALAKHLYGDDAPIVSMRAWRRIDKWFLVKLFLYYLPFRITKIFTPSDLGGRLVRLLLDLAVLRGVEVVVVPAHNHLWRRDPPLPLWRRYWDLHALQVPGSFAKRARIAINDEPMRRFFESLGTDPSRLVVVRDWLPTVYRRDEPLEYPIVFFTEVVQEIFPHLRATIVARIQQLLDEKIVTRLHVKLHPREPADAVASYRKAFAPYPGVSFIDPSIDSITVINRACVVMACFSTALLEGLWLGKRVIVLDNPRTRETMLRFYLDAERERDDFLLYGDGTDIHSVGRFFRQASLLCQNERESAGS